MTMCAPTRSTNRFLLLLGALFLLAEPLGPVAHILRDSHHLSPTNAASPCQGCGLSLEIDHTGELEFISLQDDDSMGHCPICGQFFRTFSTFYLTGVPFISETGKPVISPGIESCMDVIATQISLSIPRAPPASSC